VTQHQTMIRAFDLMRTYHNLTALKRVPKEYRALTPQNAKWFLDNRSDKAVGNICREYLDLVRLAA
jgi:hypothetical protein